MLCFDMLLTTWLRLFNHLFIHAFVYLFTYFSVANIWEPRVPRAILTNNHQRNMVGQ